MSEKPRLKYEKPVSIDMGRVAPILGDTCSVGDGAADCPAGMNNASIPICEPNGASAANDCRTGSSAGTFCWPAGSSAKVYCLSGSGFGVAAASGTEDGGYETSSYPEPSGYEYPAPPEPAGYGEPPEPAGYDEPPEPIE
ncbi:MAG: hypothetical protein EOM72_00165 [Opitutae bacterium]|nr:hypothetical protein [Opitutae bacterium]